MLSMDCYMSSVVASPWYRLLRTTIGTDIAEWRAAIGIFHARTHSCSKHFIFKLNLFSLFFNFLAFLFRITNIYLNIYLNPRTASSVTKVFLFIHIFLSILLILSGDIETIPGQAIHDFTTKTDMLQLCISIFVAYAIKLTLYRIIYLISTFYVFRKPI